MNSHWLCYVLWNMVNMDIYRAFLGAKWIKINDHEFRWRIFGEFYPYYKCCRWVSVLKGFVGIIVNDTFYWNKGCIHSGTAPEHQVCQTVIKPKKFKANGMIFNVLNACMYITTYCQHNMIFHPSAWHTNYNSPC